LYIAVFSQDSDVQRCTESLCCPEPAREFVGLPDGLLVSRHLKEAVIAPKLGEQGEWQEKSQDLSTKFSILVDLQNIKMYVIQKTF
jgi:hypothetical protein